MSKKAESVTPRREFLKSTVRIAATSALAGVAIPHVFAAEDNTIQLAIDRLWWTWQWCGRQCHVSGRAGAGWQ